MKKCWCGRSHKDHKKCKLCGKTYHFSHGCSYGKVDFPDGKTLAAIPYNPDDESPPYHLGGGVGLKRRCHDCGAMPEKFHHDGCDMEKCPQCGGQLISCGCLEKGLLERNL